MKKIKAMFIEAGSFNVTVKEIDDELKVYQDFVGGFIECVSLNPRTIMVVNDEGLMCDLKENIIASMLYWSAIGYPVSPIAGNAVIVGRDGEDFANVPPSMIFQVNTILKRLSESETSGPVS